MQKDDMVRTWLDGMMRGEDFRKLLAGCQEVASPPILPYRYDRVERVRTHKIRPELAHASSPISFLNNDSLNHLFLEVSNPHAHDAEQTNR
jgi:hypothetical protein